MSAAGKAGVSAALRSLLRACDDAVMPRTCAACGEWIAGGPGGFASNVRHTAALETAGRHDGADLTRANCGWVPLCHACQAALIGGMVRVYCGACGRSTHPLSIRECDCAECQHERHWNVAGVARVGPYDERMRHMLHRVKYAGDERCAAVLGTLMAAELRRRGWAGAIDLLVPVPMHWLRRALRPCNHARMLAEIMGRELRLPVVNATRHRHTPSQTRTHSRSERFENVKDCFDVRKPQRVAGLRVCIVDNLVVTGATIHEMSKVLRRAGAKRIYAVAAARSSLQDSGAALLASGTENAAAL